MYSTVYTIIMQYQVVFIYLDKREVLYLTGMLPTSNTHLSSLPVGSNINGKSDRSYQYNRSCYLSYYDKYGMCLVSLKPVDESTVYQGNTQSEPHDPDRKQEVANIISIFGRNSNSAAPQ